MLLLCVKIVQEPVAAVQHAADDAAHTVRKKRASRPIFCNNSARFGKLTLLTSIDTLGCTSLQLPPPHVLASGSSAILAFLSFMLAGSTGTTLDLSFQQLTSLPAACATSSLVTLSLVGNRLRCIPVEFGR